MKRYLGLSQEEIVENEKMWKEENAGNLQEPGDAGAELRSVGVTPTGMATDGAAEEAEAPAEAPPADDVSGGETAETPAV